MNKDELIKWTILDFLYKVRKERGPHEHGDLSEIAERFSIDKQTFKGVYISDLFDLGLIETAAIGSMNARITPKGIACIDRNNPFVEEYRTADIKSISINAPVTGSAIIQGDNASVDIAFDFLDKFKQGIEESSLSPEEKKTWLKWIKDLSYHPALLEILKNTCGILLR